MFCSVGCLNRDAAHQQLCVGPLEEGAPLVAFKRLAVEHCENLLLVAAAIVSAAAAAAADSREAANDPVAAAAAAKQLLLLLLQHQHGLWEEEGEVVLSPDDTETETGETDSELSDVELDRREIVLKGAQLLMQGLRPRSQVYVYLVSASLVSRLLSLFERCNTDLETANPLNEFFSFGICNAISYQDPTLRHLLVEKEALLFSLFGADEDENSQGAQGPPGPEGAPFSVSLAALRSHFASKPLEDLAPPMDPQRPLGFSGGPGAPTALGGPPAQGGFSGRGSAFPPVKGTAFYCSLARVNHSCNPNMVAEGLGSSGTGFSKRLRLRATRPISPGEELCVSYIRDSGVRNRGERRDTLRAFGFDCNCQHCASGL